MRTMDNPEPRFQSIPCINACSITLPISRTLPPPSRSETTKEVRAGTNTMMTPLTTPDIVSGTIILKKIVVLLAPKSMAASMTSFLIRCIAL